MHRFFRAMAACSLGVFILLAPAAQSKDSSDVKVPAATGLSAADARAAIKAAGLEPKFQLGKPAPSKDKALTVYGQRPVAGDNLSRGGNVELMLYDRFPGSPLSKPGGDTGPSDTQHDLQLTRVAVAPSLLQADRQLIDPRSGKLSLTATDLVIQAGPVSLKVCRALLTNPDRPGLLGSRWQLNWERRLVKRGDTVVLLDMGEARTFDRDPTGQRFRSLAGDSLAFAADRAVRTTPEGAIEVFDTAGRLIERIERNGHRIVLRYDGAGRLHRVEGPFNSFLQFVTDSAGRLSRVESSTGATIQYSYGDNTPSAQPSAQPSAEAQAISYTYNASGALVRISHPRSGDTHFAYDARGRVTLRRWADGAEERFDFDDATNTRRCIDPAGAIATTQTSSDGRRIEVIDPLKRKTIIESDAAGQPLIVTGPTGLQARFSYDHLGRPTEVQSTTSSGSTRFEYLGDTRLPTVLEAPDGKLTFAYDSRMNLLRVSSDRDKSASAAFEYTPYGLVKSVKTGDGGQSSFTYDAAGRRDSVTDAAGNTWRFEYDGHGNLLRSTDPRGGITTRGYDAQGRLTRVTDAAGATTRLEYTQQGRQFEVAVTDPRGAVSRSVYDPRGRLVSRTGPGDRMVRYNYDPAGRLTSLTDAGRAYRFEFDAGGNLLKEINPLGGTTTHSYDVMDRVTSSTDAAGLIAQFEYSRAGLLCKSIDPTGTPTQYQYDSQNRLLAVLDDAQRTTGYEYSSSSRLARITPPSGPALDLMYDDRGRLESVRRGQQVVVAYEYDLLGRRSKEKRSSGLQISYRYDPLGNLLSWGDNQNGSGKFEYDPVGRPVAATDATGATSHFQYDPAGKWQETRDPLGNVKRLTFDEAGRLNEVVEPSGDKARYEYNAAGQIAVVHHPAGGQSTFEYDALGSPTLAIDPVGSETKSKCDAAGRLLSSTDAKGQTTTFSYDAAGRLTQKRLADGKVVTYRYDARGLLNSIDDGVFPIRYTRNQDGRLTKIEYPAIKRSLSYEYNDLGLKTRFVDSEGRVVRYEYDAFDRLTAMKYGDGQTITFTYDAKNRLTSMVYPNGVKGAREYDLNDRLSRLTYTDAGGKVVAGWMYAYDAAGNRVETVNADGRKTRYNYDPSGQLTSEDASDAKPVKYRYLAGGNRAARESNGEKVQYRYDKADRLLEAGPETFVHDANGNIVERKGANGVTRYSYDAEDRLVKVLLPDGREVSFGYGPTGERVWRRDSKGLTYFITDGMNLVAELGENLEPAATYVQGPGIDRPLVMKRDGTDYYYHTDLLGSVARLTDGQGTAVASYDYDAFGTIRQKQGTVPNSLLHTAREFEPDLGLYYSRARYYNPSLGRFLTTDPLGGEPVRPRSFNPYIYVWNNPLRFTDPLGMSGESPTYMSANGEASRPDPYAGDSTMFSSGDSYRRAVNQQVAERFNHTGDRLRSGGVATTVGYIAGGERGLNVGEGIDGLISVAADGVHTAGKGNPSVLNWEEVVKQRTGETRQEHVGLHGTDNTRKTEHSVFYGDPYVMTNAAWNKAQNLGIRPVREGDSDHYFVPMPYVGRRGGFYSDGKPTENLHYVDIITKAGTNQLINSFPVKSLTPGTSVFAPPESEQPMAPWTPNNPANSSPPLLGPDVPRSLTPPTLVNPSTSNDPSSTTPPPYLPPENGPAPGSVTSQPGTGTSGGPVEVTTSTPPATPLSPPSSPADPPISPPATPSSSPADPPISPPASPPSSSAAPPSSPPANPPALSNPPPPPPGTVTSGSGTDGGTKSPPPTVTPAAPSPPPGNANGGARTDDGSKSPSGVPPALSNSSPPPGIVTSSPGTDDGSKSPPSSDKPKPAAPPTPPGNANGGARTDDGSKSPPSSDKPKPAAPPTPPGNANGGARTDNGSDYGRQPAAGFPALGIPRSTSNSSGNPGDGSSRSTSPATVDDSPSGRGDGRMVADRRVPSVPRAGHGTPTRPTPCDLPPIPPACQPGLIDLIFGLIDDLAGEHGKGDQCDELAKTIDKELTTLDKSKHLDRALTEREKAEHAAAAARMNAAQQQRREYEAKVARYNADVARYNAAQQQRHDYEAAVARYNVELSNYNAALQQREYEAAVARYNQDLANYNAAQQQAQYQQYQQYQTYGYGGGGHSNVDWAGVAGTAALIVGSFLGGGGHHRP